MSGLSPEQLQSLALLGRDSRAGSTHCFLESTADGCFQTLDDGTKIFYPQGAFGRRGYVVESRRSESALRRRAKSMRVATIIAAPLLASAYGVFLRDMILLRFMLMIAGTSAAGWFIARLVFWPLTRRLERSDIPNSPIACWIRLGEETRLAWLVLGASFFAAMSAAGFVLYAAERNPVGIVIGLMLPLAAVPYLVGIWSRWRRWCGRGPATSVDSTGARR